MAGEARGVGHLDDGRKMRELVEGDGTLADQTKEVHYRYRTWLGIGHITARRGRLPARVGRE